MNRKTTFLRWLGAFMMGAILLFSTSQLMAQDGNRNIAGSEITSLTPFYTAGATNVVLEFETSIVSPDLEWVYDASLDFPAGVTVVSATSMGVELVWNSEAGDGAITTWGDGSDYLANGDVAPFTVTVDIDPAFTGNMNIAWLLEGDGWGGAPHTVSGTITLEVPSPRLEVSPMVLDLGDRPINSWTEPAYFTLTNAGTGSITVNNVELDAADFFAVVGDFPITLAEGESTEVGVSATGDAAPGMLTGDFVTQWGASRAVVVTEFMATAYTPVEGDVVEDPFMATLPVNEVGVSTASFVDNYNLAGTATDGFDAVYSFTLATDQLVSVNLTGADAKMAVYAASFAPNDGPRDGNEIYAAEASAANLEMFAGDYYLVVSTTAASYDLAITTTAMPAPDAVVYTAPLDGAADIINGSDLEWTLAANTLEYQVILGTTYPPATVVVDWTSDLAEAYTLMNTQPNLQYFWQVNVRNGNGSAAGPIWGFTTTLTPPADLMGNTEVYEGEDVVLTWNSPLDRSFLGYNVYRDGVMQNTTMLTEATYTDVAPAYNMVPGYDYTVTAIFDEGESAMSDALNVQVTGEGTLNGNVSSLVPVAPVSGATVTMVGVDVFGEDQTYNTTTDASGNYTADVTAGTYDIRVAAEGYINAEVADVVLAYDVTVTTDFDLFETAFPVAVVTASEFGENILIEWSFDVPAFVPQVYPFETAGMSEAQINKMWNGFLAENNFDATAQSSDRALVEFQVWREKAYLPGAFEMIGTTSQMQFVDFDWSAQDWGVYKWYVVAVYDLNESDPVASNAVDMDMNVEVDVTVALNSADSPAGTMVEFTNVDESPELVYATLLPASGMFAWDEFRRGTYDIMVSYPGYAVINETGVDIFDATSFEWLLEEILATPAELYVTPTGLAMWEGGSGEVPFAPVMVDFNDGMLPVGWTVENGALANADGGSWEVVPSTAFRLMMGDDYIVADSDAAGSGSVTHTIFTSPIVPSDGEAALYVEFDQYYFYSTSYPTFAKVSVFDGSDWVLVFDQVASNGSWAAPAHNVLDVTAYANADFQVRFEYFGDWSFYWAMDNVSITNVEPVAPRAFETYKVFLDGTLLGEVTETEYQHGGFGEMLVDGDVYTTGVAAVFTTGQSPTAEFTWLYVACENYFAPTAFTAEQTIGTLDVVLNWTNVDAAALDTISALRVYRNGEELTELDFTAGAVETYMDEELEFGSYTYCLTYVYDSGAETCVDGVCSEEVIITGGGYVNGTVTAFDGGAAIDGASVMIFNEDYSFEFTTDLNGFYEGEVVDGVYDYMVSAATFESQELEAVTITFGETVTNDFSLLEFPYAVSGVVATELTDNAVLVNWGAQAPVVSEWLVYDNDVMGFGGIGAESGAYSLTWASKFVPAQLTEYGMGYVTKVSVYQLPAVGDILTEVRILGGENGETVLYAQDVTGTLIDDSWNVIELDEAVTFDNTENLWIAMYVERPAGVDIFNEPTAGALQVISDRYDYFAYNGAAWTSISGEYGVTNQAWMLRGYVTTAAGREVALGQGDYTTTGHKDYSTVKSVKSGKGMIAATKANAKFPVYANESNRELVGYSIYRTTCETGDLTFLGLTLDEQFTDNTWGAVESGVYKWGVVAEYDNNESEVVFSNCLDKDMVTTVSVSVITNSGDSPEETDVMFTNVSEPGLELTYEVELDATGFFAWDEFRKGEYDIYVEKNGFTPIMLEGYVIDGPEAFEWILEELLLPVSDLYVTPTGFATWRQGGIIPFEPFMENFDEGLPETWTVVDGGSTTDTWFNVTPAGNPQSAGSSLDGTPFMFADSDGAGSGSTMDEQMISPAIDAENADELYLMFDYLYINLATTEYFSVDVYDGDDWVEVFFSQVDSGTWPWDVATTETIDVTEYANEMFQVRFNYFSPGWNWYVAVDNVVVTDNMDRYADRELTNYKVWLDGIFITDTEETFYQYATENLVPGQEYLAEVAAMYTTGMSAKMEYTWTYIPCEDYAGPEIYTAEVVDESDVLLTWSNVEPMEIVQISQNPGAPANGYFQSFGFGYGVAYDLTAYPDALVNSLDFHHASWGTTGTWEYNIHVYDWDTKTLIETVGPISTTGNDIWEMGVELGDISVAGVNTVALLMEPLGNTAADAYPDLSSDNAANPQGSIFGDLSDPTAIGSSTIGNFLMDMYIYTAFGPVRATPVSFDYVQAPAAQAKAAVNPATEAPVISQNAVTSRDTDLFVGVNVYRNGMMIAEMVQDTFYLDEEPGGGEFTYCIRYVYESGAMTCEGAYCEDVMIMEPCDAPENLVVENLSTELGPQEIKLTWNEGVSNEFRYDDGIRTAQLGSSTGTLNTVLGNKHDSSAELTEMSWLLSDAPDGGGPHATVQIYVFGLTAAGIPDGNNVLYTASVTNVDGQWNMHEFPDAIVADGGFFLGVAYVGFVGIGTDDGLGDPYVFQPNTHYFTGDFTTGAWDTWETFNFSVNAMIRATGVEGAVASFVAETVEPTEAAQEANRNAGQNLELRKSDLAVNAGQPAWTSAPANRSSRDILGFNIYRNGELLEALWPDNTYTYEEASAGSTCYTVTAEYEFCGESDPSNEVCLDIITGIDAISLTNTRLYPNPATDNVTIEAANMNRITVINAVGQVVYDHEISAERTQLNIASYEAGIYMVRINTENGLVTKRMTIIR